MFKFIKELIDSAKEGIAEGKAEIAKEEAEEKLKAEQAKEIALSQIEGIPYNEKFGVALGANFRIVVTGDWFTMFKDSSDDELYPVHLYTFGSYPEQEKFVKDFKKDLKRDFSITDTRSCVYTIVGFFMLGDVPREGTLIGEIDNIDSDILNGSTWNCSNKSVRVLLSSVLSYIITSSTDVGYLAKEDAIKLLDQVVKYAKTNSESWADFNEQFFKGDEVVGLNNKAGRSILTKYAGYLLEKKGSPWNNIAW